MSKGLKIIVWIVVILAVLGIIAFFLGKNAWDKLTFGKPTLQGLDLQGLSLNDLANIALAGQSKTVTATVIMDIKNDNSFAIPFSSIKASFSYKGTVIAETTDNSSHTVPANGILSLPNNINIILNNAGGALLIEKLKGNHPQIDYEVDLKVFGIPVSLFYPIKDSFTL